MLVAGGRNHTLCVSDTGEVYTFGSNSLRQLGLDPRVSDGKQDVSIPSSIPNLTNIVSVSCGSYHSACLDSDGNLFTFGGGEFGQLGGGKTESFGCLEQVCTRIQNFHCGAYHTICVDIENVVWSFGMNSYGQLGLGHTRNISIPQKINMDYSIENVSCGGEHSLLLTTQGTVLVCGKNSFGQLGLGHTKSSQTPVEIPNLIVSSICCGYYHSVFLDGQTNVLVCGSNTMGQLGQKDLLPTNTVPIPIKGLPYIVSISCGYYQTRCIDEEGYIWGFGFNNAGELGNQPSARQYNPTKIESLPNIVTISGGSSSQHCIVQVGEGDIYSFGNNSHGQLGLGNKIDGHSPQKMEGRSHILRQNIRTKAKSARK